MNTTMHRDNYTIDRHGFHCGDTLATIKANCENFAKERGYHVGSGFKSTETEADYHMAFDDSGNFFFIDISDLHIITAQHNGEEVPA